MKVGLSDDGFLVLKLVINGRWITGINGRRQTSKWVTVDPSSEICFQ